MYNLSVIQQMNQRAQSQWEEKQNNGKNHLEELSHLLQFGDLSPSVREYLELAMTKLRLEGVKEDVN